MKKSSWLLCQEILDENTGKIIGRVSSIVFYPGRDSIMGFTVSCGKWLRYDKFLSYENIKKIGRDAVIVKGNSVLTALSDDIKIMIKNIKETFGKRVIDNSGEEIGFIQDIIIDEDDLHIEGYVLTDGIFDDIFKGKIILPYSQEMVFGDDAVVIKSSIKNISMRNDISVRKYIKGTFDKGTKND